MAWQQNAAGVYYNLETGEISPAGSPPPGFVGPQIADIQNALADGGIWNSPDGRYSIIGGGDANTPGLPSAFAGAPRVLISGGGSADGVVPPEIAAAFPMAPQGEQQRFAQQKATYEAGEGKAPTFGDAALAAVGSYFGGQALGGMLGGGQALGGATYLGGDAMAASGIGAGGITGAEMAGAAGVGAGATGAGVGAAGAGAGAASGIIPQLMAATGLSASQLAGLGAAGISSLTSLYGASQIGKAATTAANIGAGAADRATALQQSQYDQTRADLAPYRTAGTNALAQLTAGTAPGGQFNKSFGMSDFEQDPGYGFRMSEGLKALDRTAAARGNLLSGATLKGAQRYGQDLGSQEYQNAFNRYQTNRSNVLNPLQSLAGVGQTSTNQGITAGNTYATNVGNLGMNAAGTQANAGLTAAQANQSAYGNVGNAFANYLAPNPMNEFFQNQLNRRPVV